MDPLSITSAVISFVDIAKQIKDSVDKVGQNHQILEELMEDVIEELTELHKLCQDEQGRLGHLDPEWTCSLERLKSELMHVLDRCMKLTKRRKAHRALSSAINFLISWSKNPEIEAHIYRLRDPVSSVHRRFHYASSSRVERTENRLLVASSERSVILNRLDSAMSQLLIESHANGTYPASALDHADPNGFDYEYLHWQVQKAAAMLARISTTHIFTIKETRGPASFGYSSRHGWPSRASLMRSTTVEVLQTLQLLDIEPSNLALWEGADHLMDLCLYLSDVMLQEDAAAIFIGSPTYTKPSCREIRVPTYLTLPGDLDVFPTFTLGPRKDWTLRSGHLHLYSDHLAANGHFDDALTYAVEVLAMQRKAPTAQQGSDCLAVSWKMFSLGVYAYLLLYIALGQYQHCTVDISYWLTVRRKEHQYIASRMFSPGSPLMASISDFNEDDLGSEDSSGEGGYDAQSAALVQT
ncbi:hypothetical protein CCMSSC00406_0006072 [Pleurotus cornucopiae]|uniref:Uncharacterized protein n=1 Tax=Pleurotus cornucopiae TaxID=5321 RepID=A0ACB7J809_PLECO|nr:hypothetical protein CCMSSC00406_0006072 [Pleurotus cornucopiae]